MKKSAKVAVIGAGVAGLSSALSLLEHGYQVTLIDRRPLAGGRAYSFQRPGDPPLDNGIHVILGCYDYFQKMLALGRAREGIKLQPILEIPYRGFFAGNRIMASLTAGALPAPLHLSQALIGMVGLEPRQHIAAARLALSILRGPASISANATVTDWLKRYGQTDFLIKHLWEPITLAALNRHPDFASAALLCTVLQQAFFRTAQDSRIGFFTGPLSTAFADPLLANLQARGAEIITNARVDQLETQSDRMSGVLLDDGRKITADGFVAAVPHWSWKNWLNQQILERWPEAAHFSELGVAPITNVYLQYTHQPLDIDFACLVGTLSQWVFRVTHLKGFEHLVSVTISDAQALADLPADEVARRIHADIKRIFPRRCPDHYLRHWVIREKRSTMDHTPANEKRRPGTVTPFNNLALAGDWTATELPCTLEGAAKSGFNAAERMAATL